MTFSLTTPSQHQKFLRALEFLTTGSELAAKAEAKFHQLGLDRNGDPLPQGASTMYVVESLPKAEEEFRTTVAAGRRKLSRSRPAKPLISTVQVWRRRLATAYAIFVSA